MVPAPVVPGEPGAIYVPLWHKDPPEAGNAKANAYARPKGSPAIISAAASPVNPCRAPGGIGNPQPSVIPVSDPPSVVKRSPSPVVVTYPGVSVFCHRPVAIGIIRSELLLVYIGSPDVTIL